MSEITKGSILQSNAENECEEIEKVIEVVEKQYFKDIQNKAPVENIRFNEIILYALKEKLERENPKPFTVEELKQYAIWSNHRVVGYISLTEETANELNKNGCYFGFDKKTAPEKYLH